ncbi:MAG TPA: hypothetical protein EYP23_04120 [Thermoplasmata archaeon]|nr:hypothetical protein [Thermoplasmata archaeon]
MEVVSNDFKDGGFTPKDCTCEGRDVSPHLAWFDVPDDTKSCALIVEDPDALLLVIWIQLDSLQHSKGCTGDKKR